MENQIVEKIFITGKPGQGKTTLIKDVTFKYLEHIGGFYTEEIIEGTKRMGFRICDFKGKKEIFAYKGLKSQYKLNKYGIDIKVLEEVGVKSILDALETKKIIVIDEIGTMECKSDLFREVLIKCLNSPKNVLATIRYQSQPFTDDIKRMANSKVIFLDRGNFIEVKKEIMSWIEKVLEIEF